MSPAAFFLPSPSPSCLPPHSLSSTADYLLQNVRMNSLNVPLAETSVGYSPSAPLSSSPWPPCSTSGLNGGSIHHFSDCSQQMVSQPSEMPSLQRCGNRVMRTNSLMLGPALKPACCPQRLRKKSDYTGETLTHQIPSEALVSR